MEAKASTLAPPSLELAWCRHALPQASSRDGTLQTAGVPGRAAASGSRFRVMHSLSDGRKVRFLHFGVLSSPDLQGLTPATVEALCRNLASLGG